MIVHELAGGMCGVTASQDENGNPVKAIVWQDASHIYRITLDEKGCRDIASGLMGMTIAAPGDLNGLTTQ